ncbi:SDR family NAD(P)-dependent oxidoreductase [uncultured Pseudokineococcus sp.]|uniref:SDR family NAD(P)-dependent oxidoreductase n=1 Tax=uncultured Pseudokineococcus sp. TaxID=1642928 RepID=UPI00261B4F4F|nr:SDR family oxidoreductase [uncultured Pseudokineococcus sp.]
MLARLHGKTALITGATSGIGRVTALRLAAEGAHVAVGGRDARRGAAVVAEITAAGGRAVFVPADLDGTRATSRDIADRAEAASRGPCRRPGQQRRGGRGGHHRRDDRGPARRGVGGRRHRPLLPGGPPRPGDGRPRGGAVISISSWMAQGGTTFVPACSASKAAADALTRNWAAELGPAGVRVNTVSPGVVRPVDDPGDPGWPAVVGTPLGAFVRPEQVAAAVAYLASDDATGVHGVRLDVDGGRTSTAVIAG